MKIKVKVTKEHYKRSANCRDTNDYTGNCAVALAVREVLGYVRVGVSMITFPDYGEKANIILPPIAQSMIKEFDIIHPDNRPKLDEIEFEIEIPAKVIDSISIEHITEALKTSTNLQLVE